ncbi:MAG TPA: hypothetical protein VKH17_04655 [Acidimicrobiia bacterium]|nr:hypothetical protein [Acidimicrobiia bacterium]HMG26783.1 hypothetical protein [Acidimicrobiia bacterium]
MNPDRRPGTALQDVADTAGGDRSDLGAEPAPATATRRRRLRLPTGKRSRALLVGAGLLALLALPLVVALALLAQKRWYPILDLAMTELRIRDVGSSHPPLIGLVGRIGPLGRQGSHPGPISFWALWPMYRAFGASSWAMQVSTVALHLLAMGTALWIAFRRAGIRLMIAVAAVLALLTHAYGALTLTQPWNPYLPLLCFIVFVLALWSIVAGDAPMLPVAALAGSFCAQTHVPYLGLVVGLSAFTVAVASWSAYRQRVNRAALRRYLTWLAIAAGVTVVVWIPPVIDQIVHDPGNLSVLSDYFRNPPEAPVGLRRAIDVIFVHLNPFHLVQELTTDRTQVESGSSVPGVLFLGVWIASVVAAWRVRNRTILRLDLVLGVALVLALVSTSRIFGLVWYYLVLWAWGITSLMILAIGWTAAVLVRRRLEGDAAARAARLGTAVLVAVVVVLSAVFTYNATSVDVPAPRLSHTLGVLTRRTAAALDRPSAPGGGRDGRYLVTLRDPVDIGAMGYGLVNELERRGFDVGVIEGYGPGATRYRVRPAADATGIVHLAIGPEDIATWRAKADVRQVAAIDPRTPKQRNEFDLLHTEVLGGLRNAHLTDLLPTVDENLFRLGLDTRVPDSIRRRVVRMTDLGLPAAVFVGPREAVTET